MTHPQILKYHIDGNEFSFTLLMKSDLPSHDMVNIFASGPSVEQQVFDNNLLSQACIFVNGSISLLNKHHFQNIAGYVISDARFIEHSLPLIKNNYTGQAWYITLPVLQALIKQAPDLVTQYNKYIRLIFAIDRPIVAKKNSLIGNILNKKQTYRIKKVSITDLENDAFIINSAHQPPIGLSLDITKGFVEAGTVAFIATQLAFSMQAKEIHLFGIDLINTQEPRFYENQGNKAPIMLEKAVKDRIVPSFDLLASEYKKYDCEVYNHSPVSKTLFNNVLFMR